MRSKRTKLFVLSLIGLLVFGLAGCGGPKEEEEAQAPEVEQPEEMLEALSPEEMNELLPDSWPDGWTLCPPGYVGSEGEALVDTGSIALFLGKGEGKIGPAQKVQINIEDLMDLNAEKSFEPMEEGTTKTPTGTVIVESTTLKGHTAQLSKVPEMMNTITLKFCAGRFEIEAIGRGDEGTSVNDLKALCGALKLPQE